MGLVLEFVDQPLQILQVPAVLVLHGQGGGGAGERAAAGGGAVGAGWWLRLWAAWPRRFLLCQIQGDWKELIGSLGFPSFNRVFRPCLGGCGRRSSLNESWIELLSPRIHANDAETCRPRILVHRGLARPGSGGDLDR